MRYQLELFFTALGFFTRIPVPAWVPWSAERMNHAARYLALVGWVVGAAGALGYLALAWLLPPAVAVILSMALTIRLTGAFHEDGLADSCDGLGGGWDKAQVLAIMKDSRIGSYGTIGMVLMLLAKAAALVELAEPAALAPLAGSATSVLPADPMSPGVGVALALLVAHPLSRLAATVVMHRLPYVRADDSAKSAAVARPLAPAELALAAACGLIPLLLLPPASALGALLAAAAVTVWTARLFRRRLGGYTGDLLGATQQASELAIYLGLLVVAPL
jgi:adenosylcobinamide-GDP ribazoletransferase